MKILLVDDEKVALTSLKRLLRRRGYPDVDMCDNGGAAVEKIRENDYDLVLLDLLMPDMDGIQVLFETKSYKPETEFILVTAVDDVAMAVKAVRAGAYDYLIKPVDPQRLVLTIERAFEHKGLRSGLTGDTVAVPDAFQEIITRYAGLKKLLQYAQVMARGSGPILITGETGTGKELLARGVHAAGPTPNGPFVAVNVASIPETLFESQFFGHKKGAFTGADQDHTGFFMQADGGTLFLDEIGELPIHLQPKLLRVLEEKQMTRIGDTRSLPVNVRVISATNQDIDAACRDGRFRLDLLYRLKGAYIHLPPLRERFGDIPILVDHFIGQAAREHGKPIKKLTPEALAILQDKPFPGNIRELRQILETAALMAEGEWIGPRHLGETSSGPQAPNPALCTLKEATDAHVVFVLRHAKGDRRATADILGVTVRQVQRRISQLKNSPTWREHLAGL